MYVANYQTCFTLVCFSPFASTHAGTLFDQNAKTWDMQKWSRAWSGVVEVVPWA